MTVKKTIILFTHAFVVWVLCGATIGMGRSVASMETTLIIHAMVAPVFASIISFIYYRNFNYTSPLKTAGFFLLLVFILDAGLVAPVVEKSYEMFTSILGTWLPFALIFLATLLTGLVVPKKN